MADQGKPEFRCAVRSFVLREGRLTPGQQRAFTRCWPQYGVEFSPDQTVELPTLFGNANPVTLEIGFGNGESLAEQATRFRDQNFLGVDVHSPGIGHLLLLIEEQNLRNLRIVRHDAVELLESGLAPDSLHRIQLFFPDPWPKKKHRKRRIVQPSFLQLVDRVLVANGIFHVATDWESYAEHMLSVLEADSRFENLAGRGQYAPRPAARPETKFERRGQRLGHSVWDLVYRKR